MSLWCIAQPGYYPGALTDTTFLRRKIVSGICTSISDTMQVGVLPSISLNTITSSLFVSVGSLPDSC